MFKSRNETVTGEDVINNLIASYYEMKPYTGESDIIHELKKALIGGDSFNFGLHSIVVSAPEGQFMSQMMKSYAKMISKWPKRDLDWVLHDVQSSARTAYNDILALSGPTEYMYQLQVRKEERNKEWVLMQVTINASKIAYQKKNGTLGEASLLYGFFECLRLMKLNWATREMNSSSDS
jgi:hypothetical protein